MRVCVDLKIIVIIFTSIVLFIPALLFAQDFTSITLNWTAPGDDGDIGTATLYDIRYSTNPINDANWGMATQVNGEPNPKPPGEVESFTVGNLNPNTTYYFAVKAADEMMNWSSLSNIAVVTTIDNMPPAQTSDLDAEPGTENGELVLTWTSSGDDGMTGTADSYQIYYSKDSMTISNWQSMPIWENPPQPIPGGQVQQFTMSGLDPGGIYWVAIVTVDDAMNVSEVSNIVKDTAKFDIVADADDGDDQIPVAFELRQNYPNPFNPETVIEYSLASEEFVNLSIYNTLGQRVATLVDWQEPAGWHSVRWNGTDDEGLPVSSGIYLYVIRTLKNVEKRKMVLLK